MEKTSYKQYRFDQFKLDSRSCCLYFDDKLVESINKKSLQVLIILLEKPKEVVSNEEIIEKVWGNKSSGIDPRNVAQYILKLRKSLAQYQPNKTFIGTGNKRGYIFEQDVITEAEPIVVGNLKDLDTNKVEESNENEVKEHLTYPFINSGSDSVPLQDPKKTRKSWRLNLVITILGLMILAIAVITYFSKSEEDKVRQVVKDSQMFESLILYQNPISFDENKLKEYWIDESHNNDLDSAKIKKSLKNLIEKGIRYGKESKCEKFDFVSIDVNETEDFALAKTIEKWFVAKYRNDGTLLENKTIGPYAVTYNLQKINGKWLIEKSSTARVVQ